jgi:hypothetical protein
MVSTQIREGLHIRAVINLVRSYAALLTMPRQKKDGMPMLLP